MRRELKHPNVAQPLFAHRGSVVLNVSCHQTKREPRHSHLQTGEQEYFGLALKLADGGNLAQFVRKHSPHFPGATTLPVAMSIARALEHFESRSFVHGNLHPANLLIDGNPGAC